MFPHLELIPQNGEKKVFNNLRLPTRSSTSTSLTRLWIHKSPGRKSCTENEKSEESTMSRCQKWRKFSKSSSLLYLFLSKHKPTDHCSILQLHISQEQRHQKTIEGCSEQEVLLIYSRYLSYFQLILILRGFLYYLMSSRERSVWLHYFDGYEWWPLSEWRPGKQWCIFQSLVSEKWTHYIWELKWHFLCGVKLNHAWGSGDDITLNQYLRRSSGSWRPQVRPSVCPPSRSARPGPQTTCGRSEWT